MKYKNKKVDEDFKYIKDVYLLQCMCTEMKDYIIKLQQNYDIILEYNNRLTKWLFLQRKEIEKLRNENK